MKRLVCLCALLFAGHAMAQTTCSDATLNGTFLVSNESGELAAAVHLYAEGEFTFNGNGTGQGSLNFTETGGLINGGQTESITYTVNPDCSFTGTGSIAGLTVAIKGHTTPAGTKLVFVTQTAGIATNGVATKP